LLRVFKFGLAVVTLAMLIGCAPDYSPNTYNSNAVQQANKVEPAIVVGFRQVQISANGTIGAVTGGAAGGVLGSQSDATGISSALGTVGGSLVGGLVGTTIEHATGDTTGWEYIVRKPNGDLLSVTQREPTPLPLGQKVLVITGNQARIVPDYSAALDPPPAPTSDKDKAAAKERPAPPTTPVTATPGATPSPTSLTPPSDPAAPSGPAFPVAATPSPTSASAPAETPPPPSDQYETAALRSFELAKELERSGGDVAVVVVVDSSLTLRMGDFTSFAFCVVNWAGERKLSGGERPPARSSSSFTLLGLAVSNVAGLPSLKPSTPSSPGWGQVMPPSPSLSSFSPLGSCVARHFPQIRWPRP
jgi:outer membrane lipoprotein SlyB